MGGKRSKKGQKRNKVEKKGGKRCFFLFFSFFFGLTILSLQAICVGVSAKDGFAYDIEWKDSCII